MKKKGLLIALFAIVLGCGAIAGTVAFFTDQKSQTNVFTMGNVDISLTEPKFETNTGGTFEVKNVTPNQTIVKDPTITVAGDSSDTYVRAKIAFEGINVANVAELEANIALTTGWKKSTDGYYYYNTALKGGDEVTVFETVTIPSSWTGAEVTGKFNIVVTAEAIQADNFTPTSVDGYITSWGSVVIK